MKIEKLEMELAASKAREEKLREAIGAALKAIDDSVIDAAPFFVLYKIDRALRSVTEVPASAPSCGDAASSEPLCAPASPPALTPRERQIMEHTVGGSPYYLGE